MSTPRNRIAYERGQAARLTIRAVLEQWPPTQPRPTAKILARLCNLSISERQITNHVNAIARGE